MSLTPEQKRKVVEEVSEVAGRAHSVVAAEYRGISVEELTTLRVKAREVGVYVRVVKNTLARKAFEGTQFECMQDRLVGPLILAFSQEDPGSAARVVKEYVKGNEKLKVTMVSIGGQVLEADALERVSTIPTRDEALSLLLAVIRAPMDKFARTLNEVPGKLVRTVAAIRDQKEAA